MSDRTVTRQEIEEGLRRLSVAEGDMVMVHASLRAVGPIEGGAETLVASLLEVLGESGTILAYVDYLPTEDVPYFDPSRSPARPEYGILAEIIRSWPGAVRSRNPGASIASIGAQAEGLCADHPLDFGYGVGSPLEKLVRADGKVLLLGSDLDQVTLLHYAEHCARLDHKRITAVNYDVINNGEVHHVAAEEFDTGDPVLDEMPERYFADLTGRFIEEGGAQVGRVGNAESYLLPAPRFIDFAVRIMEEEYGHDAAT